MKDKRVVRQDALLLAIFAIAVATYLLSVALTGNYAPLSSPALAQEEVAQPMVVDSRTLMLNGVEVGEVTMADEVLLRIRTAAGGYSSEQRAVIVGDDKRFEPCGRDKLLHPGPCEGQRGQLLGSRCHGRDTRGGGRESDQLRVGEGERRSVLSAQ